MGTHHGQMGNIHEKCVSPVPILRNTHDANKSSYHSVSKLSEMTAVGLGLPAEFFSDAGRYGLVFLFSTIFCTKLIQFSSLLDLIFLLPRPRI